MREILSTLESWIEAGHSFATCTVTETWGSSPRPVGSVMAVRDDGLICGSVSGGCVETTVVEAAVAAIEDQESRELKFDAITDESVWEVGLSCGGQVQIWVEPQPNLRSPQQWQILAGQLKADRAVVWITRLDGRPSEAWLPDTQDPTGGQAEKALATRRSFEVQEEGQRIFLNAFPCRERIVIVGSVHIAVPLIKFARECGFETIVVDPRSAFANVERFPYPPDKLIVSWPEEAFAQIGLHSETYVTVLTHDPKIDDIALSLALNSPVAYIGALGSRKTQAKRREQLGELGFSDQTVSRIHGPIGLNIGAKSPEEIAISIMAEIIQVRRARQA